MGVAKAFAGGPKPRRSLVFVWHTGEERGLWGSRYYADYPSVPIDAVVAQLNMDMIGRNRDDKPEEANTVYLVGSDRISTELHNIGEDANAGMPKPLTFDYEMNDPADPEGIYFGAITTATRRRGYRSSSTRPGCTRTTTRTPTRWIGSTSRR